MQNCNQTCSWCANNFFRWWKAREGQMSKPRKGETTTFMQAVETSIRA